jgi:hypothetical protein
VELLPAIVGLAVVDSINPSALLATIALLRRGRPARPLVAVYVAAVLVSYFAIGLVLTLGLGLTPEALLESDAAYLLQGSSRPPLPGRARRHGPGRPGRRGLAAPAGHLQPDLRAPPAGPAGHPRRPRRSRRALLERLRTHLGGAAREGLLWLLGLVGFFLLADTLAHVGVID